MANQFKETTEGIAQVVETWEERLRKLPENTITLPRNIQKRNIKQILGHLVDSASNNHQRMVRLQYNPTLVFPDYRQDNDLWIALQDYEHEDWQTLISLWKYFNLHIIQVINTIDATKLKNTWGDFEGNVVSLQEMITGYLDHLNLHMSQIEELINQ